jgi:hypothetical protein
MFECVNNFFFVKSYKKYENTLFVSSMFQPQFGMHKTMKNHFTWFVDSGDQEKNVSLTKFWDLGFFWNNLPQELRFSDKISFACGFVIP